MMLRELAGFGNFAMTETVSLRFETGHGEGGHKYIPNHCSLPAAVPRIPPTAINNEHV
jgi:hypothetical protein